MSKIFGYSAAVLQKMVINCSKMPKLSSLNSQRQYIKIFPRKLVILLAFTIKNSFYVTQSSGE